MSGIKITKLSEKESMTESHRSLKNLTPIMLLKPEFENGKSVLKALKQRKTIREISDKKLS